MFNHSIQRWFNSLELKHHVKINRLVNVAKSTSLVVDTNSKKLTDIWDSVKNDELLLRDLTLKSDLISVFNSLHSSFLASITRLNAFQNAHSSLLLEFEFYLQLDSKNIHECILNRKFCFLRHGIFRCAQNCYLTSENDF